MEQCLGGPTGNVDERNVEGLYGKLDDGIGLTAMDNGRMEVMAEMVLMVSAVV